MTRVRHGPSCQRGGEVLGNGLRAGVDVQFLVDVSAEAVVESDSLAGRWPASSWL